MIGTNGMYDECTIGYWAAFVHSGEGFRHFRATQHALNEKHTGTEVCIKSPEHEGLLNIKSPYSSVSGTIICAIVGGA